MHIFDLFDLFDQFSLQPGYRDVDVSCLTLHIGIMDYIELECVLCLVYRRIIL